MLDSPPTEAAQGIQEIILISKITTNYGQDIYGKPSLARLLKYATWSLILD